MHLAVFERRHLAKRKRFERFGPAAPVAPDQDEAEDFEIDRFQKMLQKREVVRTDLMKIVDHDPHWSLGLLRQVAQSNCRAIVEQPDLRLRAPAAALGESLSDFGLVDLSREPRVQRIQQLLLRRDQELGDQLFTDNGCFDSRRTGSDPESHAVLVQKLLPDRSGLATAESAGNTGHRFLQKSRQAL